jgi:hypothetical protein
MHEMPRSYVLPMLSVLAGLVSSAGSAADIVIQREVPFHNVLEKEPPGYATSVPASQEGLVLGAVPGAKIIGDDIFGDIVASRPSAPTEAAQRDAVQNANDPSRGNAASNLPLAGAFSSLGGVGGQISGEVGSAVGNGLQGLSGALGTITPGGR